MPLNACLKQLVNFVPGGPKLLSQNSTNRNGWNGLPEDIILLILHNYLKTDVPALKSLSQTCRSYSSFCRPLLLRTVSIKDPEALDGFTDTGAQMRMQSRRMGLTMMTSVGEALLYILSHTFPRLSTFELPRLREHQDWSTLPRALQDAVLSFLKRHPLEEVSLTTHYPLDLLRSCARLQKLECRVYSPTTRPFNTPLPPHQVPERSAPLVLRELVIQDPSDMAGTIIPNLVRSDAWIAVDKLEKLTYYGDKTPSHPLPLLLSYCVETLSSLKIYVGDSGKLNRATCLYMLTVTLPTSPRWPVLDSRMQPLNLSPLKNLTHLTLSHDLVRYGAGSFAWIYGTLEFLLRLGTSRLQTVEMVIRAGNPSITELFELARGWVVMWAEFIVSLELVLSEPVVNRVQRIQISGYLDEGAVLAARGGTRFSARFVEAGQTDLPGGNVTFTEDVIQRWVRVPETGPVPPY